MFFMYFLRYFPAAALVAAFFSPALAGESAVDLYRGISAATAAGAAGRQVVVDIDLEASPGYSADVESDRLAVRYRMGFNQVAEGWSWQPRADPAAEDYYRFKYLPLGSVGEERGEYVHEDKIGEPQRMRIVWRYDYFLAFDNLHTFITRTAGDDPGFSADLPARFQGRVALRAKARLVEPVTAESTTFWKATHAQPSDFTLKKHYLVASLESVEFLDGRNGEVLCSIPRGAAHCTSP
jgi:hypothetical protein